MKKPMGKRAIPTRSASEEGLPWTMTILLYLLVGLIIGVIGGLMGIGGGILLVPAFVFLFRFSHEMAIGTTLAILVPPIGLMAAWEYYRRGQVNLEAAAVIAAAFVVGAYGGAKLVPYLPVQLLRLLFASTLIYIGVRFIFYPFPEATSAWYGLLAVGLAWIIFLALRFLGRRHLPRPDLGEKIRALRQPDRTGPDYYI